ncbi:MAG: molybdenum cofactor cytidylyltransferase [Alphaproteobacteria bacterium]|jgi:molybdenum cofactor cytidylyltransferase
MKFENKPVINAIGMVSAHSHSTASGRISKGTTLEKLHIDELISMGVSDINVYHLEEDDVEESKASLLIAKAIANESLKVSLAFNGRTRIYAEKDSIFLVNKSIVDQINQMDESIAISTLNDQDIAYKNDLVLSVKIITYSISNLLLNQVLDLIKKNWVIFLKPFHPLSLAVIYTKSKNQKESLINNAKKTLSKRIEEFNSTISEIHECSHEYNEIKNAIDTVKKANIDLIVIFSASSVSDRRDIVPQAIESMHGKIIHFGMPVDPGNLTLFAQLDHVKIIAVAGSARSESLNGFDWFLNRLHAGIDINHKEINKLGVGGLLHDLRSYSRRKKFEKTTNSRKKNVVAIILAAGQSTRMGDQNKLLLKINENSMIKDYINKLNQCNLANIIVVTGHESSIIKEDLSDTGVLFAHNKEHKVGISSSIKAGVSKLESHVDAVLICLPDMPFVSAHEINQLIDNYSTDKGQLICVPTSFGQRGNPVLWDKRFFNELMQLEGDIGAKNLIDKYKEYLIEVSSGESVITDIDTKERYNSYFKED